MNPEKIAIILGTRPEAIKLAPVINTLKTDDSFAVSVIFTGQHRDLVRPIFDFFDLVPDFDLDIMNEGQDLNSINRAILKQIPPIYQQVNPDILIVQGDTTTAYAAALAGFYHKTPIIHLEAGLRSGDRYNPYPEEINRRLITQLTTLHLAATEYNRQTLLKENIPDEQIRVTGNPVIDALQSITNSANKNTPSPEILKRIDSDHRLLLLTTHRRENWGSDQKQIFNAIKKIVADFEDVEVIFPAHPNPVVMKAAEKTLGNRDRIHLSSPLAYFDFLEVMKRSYFILTDSGGLQEEAPVFGKPVLILRNTTERQEVIESGQGKLIGTDSDRIYEESRQLLTNPDKYDKMARAESLYGEGDAAATILQVIKSFDFSNS